MASVEPAEVWSIAPNLCSACLDGQYENCYCDDEEKLEKDLSCDSLDECSDTEQDVTRTKHKRNSIYDEYISDDEFQDTDVNRRLPPPTTDWDSIDSVLEKELDTRNDVEDTALSKRLSQNVNMQMVFVESEDSDNDDDDTLDYTGDTNYTDSSRSGSGAESNRRTTTTTSTLETVEERKLDHDEKINGKAEFIDEIHQKNVDELRTMKDFLECHIAKLNFELLEQLEVRDYLYSDHEALLLDADDLSSKPSDSNTTKNSEDTKPSNNTTPIESKPKPQLDSIDEPSDKSPPPNTDTTGASSRTPTKRKRFWWR